MTDEYGWRQKRPHDSDPAPISCPTLQSCIRKETELKVMEQFKVRVGWVFDIKLKGQPRTNDTEFKGMEAVKLN